MTVSAYDDVLMNTSARTDNNTLRMITPPKNEFDAKLYVIISSIPKNFQEE